MNRFFPGMINTAYDFGFNLLKSSLIEDDKSPIRSGHGVECGPFSITTITLSLEHIKQIKTKLQVTVNDVITGAIIFGTRLYMQRENQDSSKASSTALVLLNTRAIGGYKSATARYIYGKLNNSSLMISNMIGPVEQMALANIPIKGLYFTVPGIPQSLQLTIVSYVEKLRIVMSVEKGFIDPNKFKSCIEYAFEAISKAALE
ncbi:O-acyltransferase WSD1-like isoform X1 [Olea europaea subsp. europaea]|uniref:O-acyltransferase WSD1-like isoform X1 n=1 Tax=Olea europaea subsp. europaea TaxID=158383 RepID=A0A8S0UVB9_OLEEU|nr:O-acyltransferase WSD1-like isoform X1 [Olea europaea subsp. europaea]